MLQLYINGKLVDTDKELEIPITYQLTDLSNPTAIKNDYSKTIQLPGTKNNNDIFGHIYKLDRIIPDNNSMFSSIFFDARKRVDYVILLDGFKYSEGYLKLDNISLKNGKITYSITLFGGIGNFFYNLKYNSDGTERSLADLYYGLKTSTGYTMSKDEEYNNVLFDYNKDYITECWDNISTDMGWWGYLTDKPDSIYNVFCPIPCYSGYYDNFDSDKAIINIQSDQYLPGVKQKLDIKSTDEYQDINDWILCDIGNEVDEFAMRELRSHYQLLGTRYQAIYNAIKNPENNGGFTVDDSNVNQIEKDYIKYMYLVRDRFDYDNIKNIDSNNFNIELKTDVNQFHNQHACYELELTVKDNPSDTYSALVNINPYLSLYDNKLADFKNIYQSGTYAYVGDDRYSVLGSGAQNETDPESPNPKLSTCAWGGVNCYQMWKSMYYFNSMIGNLPGGAGAGNDPIRAQTFIDFTAGKVWPWYDIDIHGIIGPNSNNSTTGHPLPYPNRGNIGTIIKSNFAFVIEYRDEAGAKTKASECYLIDAGFSDADMACNSGDLSMPNWQLELVGGQDPRTPHQVMVLPKYEYKDAKADMGGTYYTTKDKSGYVYKILNTFANQIQKDFNINDDKFNYLYVKNVFTDGPVLTQDNRQIYTYMSNNNSQNNMTANGIDFKLTDIPVNTKSIRIYGVSGYYVGGWDYNGNLGVISRTVCRVGQTIPNGQYKIGVMDHEHSTGDLFVETGKLMMNGGGIHTSRSDVEPRNAVPVYCGSPILNYNFEISGNQRKLHSPKPYVESTTLGIWQINTNKAVRYDGADTALNISMNNEPHTIKKTDIFSDTKTPFDYLMYLSRLFNWYIEQDKANPKLIHIYSNNKYFNNKITDISNDLDYSDVKITPTTIQYNALNMSFNNLETYPNYLNKKMFGDKYNIKTYNTGYDISSENKDLFEDVELSKTPMYQLTSVFYNNRNLNLEPDYNKNYILRDSKYITPFMGSEFETTLYKRDDNGLDSKSTKTLGWLTTGDADIRFSQDAQDSTPKIALFDKDYGSVDTDNLVVMFDPEYYLNKYIEDTYNKYYITDNIPAAFELNNNNCWIFANDKCTCHDTIEKQSDVDKKSIVTEYAEIPTFSNSFSNWKDKNDNHYILGFTNERCKEDAYYGSKQKVNLYDLCWDKYLNDVYDKDAKSIEIKYKLKENPKDAMKHFYTFDNAIWRLNKITDYKPGYSKFTKCEFVKVKNIDNYIYESN